MRSSSSREQAYQAPVNPHSSRLSKVCPPVNRRPVSLPLFTRQCCFSLLGSGFFQERHSKKLKPMTIDAMTSNHHISVNSVYLVRTTLRRWRCGTTTQLGHCGLVCS